MVVWLPIGMASCRGVLAGGERAVSVRQNAEMATKKSGNGLWDRGSVARVGGMSAKARLADLLLRDAGHGGLWEWAMEQRRRVKPPNWDEVAERLEEATEGQISVRGDVLRRWLLAAEAARDEANARAGEH